MTPVTVTNERVAEILDAARERMNTGGKHWTQGRLKRKIGKEEYAYCSLGGIYATTTSAKERHATIKALAHEITGEELPIARARRAVWRWNDDPNRGWRTVRAVFLRAEKNLLRKKAA